MVYAEEVFTSTCYDGGHVLGISIDEIWPLSSRFRCVKCGATHQSLLSRTFGWAYWMGAIFLGTWNAPVHE